MELNRTADDGIESLNRDCYCISLDTAALRREIETHADTRDVYELIRDRCPHMFAATPVFISRHHLEQMKSVIDAVEAVIALPAYQDNVLAWAPQIAGFEPRGARGVFLSYDFHLGTSGPRLIEINTNAGGALLNAALARAQHACCAAMENMSTVPVPLQALNDAFFQMFLAEWRLARGNVPLRRIAIVDEKPQDQYLYPEFILFRQLFRHHDIEALIVDPSELRRHEGRLLTQDEPVDLVYNRLTDFSLDAPAHAALREAYLHDEVVMTPHPRAHALYANKRNLALLTNADQLRRLGVADTLVQVLSEGIPATQTVSGADAEKLWAARRGLFFKPASGFGSKAAYRGDKLTKRAWEEILAGDYVAQKLVPPGARVIADHEAQLALKFDVRNYVYDGAVQFVTARLYQGQTTNFRTPGGGFAPVFTEGKAQAECPCDDGIARSCEAPGAENRPVLK
jgi:hypothetical protein